MFRYLVFAYDDFYPSGGMEDCILKTNSFEEAMNKAHTENFSNTNIYDVFANKIIEVKS